MVWFDDFRIHLIISTNSFREGCVEALLALVENISVNKAVSSICESGINHKSVVVKTQVAKLIDHVISAIGPERFYGSSKDTQVLFAIGVIHELYWLWKGGL